jgi:hypothetical protein
MAAPTEEEEMGAGNFDPGAYRAFSQSTVGKSTSQIYKSAQLQDSLNPLGVKLRESRDSADNPNSTPLIVALDVTGSMGILADAIARHGLGTLFTGVLERKPIADPHVMFMGIGDAFTDEAPLQVSQFEADNRIVEQVQQLWLEGHGGGNDSESYHLAWYFAAFHTEHDSIVKRGKRGYLFTVGDECAPPSLTPEQVKRICGDTIEADLPTADLLALAQRKFDVFHIVIAEGGYARMNLDKVMGGWRQLMGERVICLRDHSKLAETIVTAIEVAEGRDAAQSASAWGSSGHIVLDAVKSLPRGNAPKLLGAA